MSRLFTNRACVALAALTVLASAAEAADFKIGMVVPLSGIYGGSEFGPKFRKGMELGVETVNKAGGLPANLTFVIQDGEANPEVASKATERVLLRENANVVVGELSSTATLAMMPIVAREKVPLLALASHALSITEKKNPYVVRTAPNTVHLGHSMADWIHQRLKIKRVGIVVQQNDYGTEFLAAFKERLAANGQTLAFQEMVAPSVQDFSAIASKLASVKPALEAVVGLASLPQTPPLLRAAAEQGLKVQWLGGQYLTAAMEQQAGALAEGMFIQTFYDPATTLPAGRDFAQKYRAKYNEEPDLFSAEAYESALVVGDALKRGGTDPAKFLAALRSTRNLQGPMGPVTFDEAGQASFAPNGKRVLFYQIKAGKRVLASTN